MNLRKKIAGLLLIAAIAIPASVNVVNADGNTTDNSINKTYGTDSYGGYTASDAKYNSSSIYFYLYSSTNVNSIYVNTLAYDNTVKRFRYCDNRTDGGMAYCRTVNKGTEYLITNYAYETYKYGHNMMVYADVQLQLGKLATNVSATLKGVWSPDSVRVSGHSYTTI